MEEENRVMMEYFNAIKKFIKPSLFAIFASVLFTLFIVIILRDFAISMYISVILFGSTGIVYNVIVTPIVEEILKFVGYGYIFLIDFKRISTRKKIRFNYESNHEFIIRNILWMAVVIGITFGVIEGILYYLDTNKPLIEILPHASIHVMFIVTPIMWWFIFRKKILFFLPVAIIMHMLSNLRYATTDLDIYPIIALISIIFIIICFAIPTIILTNRFVKKIKKTIVVNH